MTLCRNVRRGQAGPLKEFLKNVAETAIAHETCGRSIRTELVASDTDSVAESFLPSHFSLSLLTIGHALLITKLPASRRAGSRKWIDRPGCPFCVDSQLFDELCVHGLTTRPVNRQLKRETPLSTLPTPWKLRLPSAIPLSAPALDQLQRRGVPAADRRHLLQL
jgi:hypothetical protein